MALLGAGPGGQHLPPSGLAMSSSRTPADLGRSHFCVAPDINPHARRRGSSSSRHRAVRHGVGIVCIVVESVDCKSEHAGHREWLIELVGGQEDSNRLSLTCYTVFLGDVRGMMGSRSVAAATVSVYVLYATDAIDAILDILIIKVITDKKEDAFPLLATDALGGLDQTTPHNTGHSDLPVPVSLSVSAVGYLQQGPVSRRLRLAPLSDRPVVVLSNMFVLVLVCVCVRARVPAHLCPVLSIMMRCDCFPHMYASLGAVMARIALSMSAPTPRRR